MKKDNNQIRKHNMKIYSLYRMLSADHIFYYAIEFIFLTQVKNISAADIVFATAAFSFFNIILQIPGLVIVDRLGNKKSTVLANLFIATFVFLVMNCQNIWMLIFAQFVDAIGFSLKEASDTSLLNNSIPISAKKGEIFSKIEGKGVKNFYYITAIASVIAGFIYEIDPYIPLMISLAISILSTIISLGFEDVCDENENPKEKINFKSYLKELMDACKFIVKSNRLKALLIYCGIIYGTITLMGTYTTSLLEEIGTIAVVIAISSAIREIASGIGAKKQLQFHNKFKNKSLKVMLIITFVCTLIIGLFGRYNLNTIFTIITVTLFSMIINFVRGTHEVLSLTYLQNFTTPKIISKIYAMNSLCINLFTVIIAMIGSILLRFTNTANSTIIFSIMFLVVIVWLIMYMKSRLGLKPEEYKPEDIKFE